MLGLLGSYDSDDERSDGTGSGSGSDNEPHTKSSAKKPQIAAPPRPATAVASGDAKKRKVDISRLPCSKLAIESTVGNAAEAPLRKSAELANLRMNAGRSLLASLPAPKVTLGADTSQSGGGGGGGSRIDLSGISKPKKEAESVNPSDFLRSESASDSIPVLEGEEVPDGLKQHPMFSAGPIGQRAKPDGPSEEDLLHIRQSGGAKGFKHVNAKDIISDDWQMDASVNGGSTAKGAKVAPEVSMYDSKGWKGTTHANPSKNQTRKHQINWLANEAMDKEAELLDRNAAGRLTKSQTSMKYGW